MKEWIDLRLFNRFGSIKKTCGRDDQWQHRFPMTFGTNKKASDRGRPARSPGRVSSLQLAHQRLQPLLIGSGAIQGGAEQGLADLGGAGGADRALGLVESQAAVVPGQVAIGQQAPGLAFQVVHHRLVADVEDSVLG